LKIDSRLYYALFELKLDFSSKLESFVKDVSKFGVVSVTKKHCSTSLVKEAESQAHIPQESKLGDIPQLKRKTTVNFQTKVNYERLEISSICLYFIHILQNIIKVSSFGFHSNQYFFNSTCKFGFKLRIRGLSVSEVATYYRMANLYLLKE
jgi:hypothetical protein